MRSCRQLQTRGNEMSLPDNYGKRLRSALKAVAVWLPGKPVSLGSIMAKEDNSFTELDQLSSFTDKMKSGKFQDINLNLVSSGTRQRLFQANAELPSTAALDLSAEASVKYEFSGAFEYVLKTPTLQGEHITNLNQIANAVRNNPDWKHKEFYLVHEVYNSDQFSFVGTEKTKRTFEISGKGSAILSFLSAGASAGLSKTGDVQVELLGKGGSIAMGLVRIKPDGSLNFFL